MIRSCLFRRCRRAKELCLPEIIYELSPSCLFGSSCLLLQKQIVHQVFTPESLLGLWAISYWIFRLVTGPLMGLRRRWVKYTAWAPRGEETGFLNIWSHIWEWVANLIAPLTESVFVAACLVMRTIIWVSLVGIQETPLTAFSPNKIQPRWSSNI